MRPRRYRRGDARQRDEVFEASEHRGAGLPSHALQHPFEFQENGLRDEQVTAFQQVAREIRLRGVVLEVVAREDIGINRARSAIFFAAARPFRSPTGIRGPE